MQPQRRVVFLSSNDLDRMLARKCTKGSNLKDIWRWRSWLLSLKSRRCGIFLYQLLERLFYVSCVRVGKKLHWRACPYPLSFFKRWPFCTECKERGIFEPYLIQQKMNFYYDIIFFRSHPYAFSLDGSCQCLILSGNCETESQLWMRQIRDVLWPRAPNSVLWMRTG